MRPFRKNNDNFFKNVLCILFVIIFFFFCLIFKFDIIIGKCCLTKGKATSEEDHEGNYKRCTIQSQTKIMFHYPEFLARMRFDWIEGNS